MQDETRELVARLGSGEVEIEIAETRRLLPLDPDLKGVEGVLSWRFQDGVLRAQVANPSRSLPAVLSRLEKQRLLASRVDVRPPSLDQLLHELVANLTFNPTPPPPDRLAIQDLDQSGLSKKVSQQLLNWRGLTAFALGATDEPLAYVGAHPDVVAVVLPKGLEASVITRSAMPLQTYVNRRGRAQDGVAPTAASNAGVELSGVAIAVEAARLQAARAHLNEDAAAQRAEKDSLTRFQIGRQRN